MFKFILENSKDFSPNQSRKKILDNGLQMKERKKYYTIRPNYTFDLCGAKAN